MARMDSLGTYGLQIYDLIWSRAVLRYEAAAGCEVSLLWKEASGA